MEESLLPQNTPFERKKKAVAILVSFFVIGFSLMLYYFFIPPIYPSIIPGGVQIEVSKGSSARQVAKLLKKQNIISSEVMFVALVSLRGDDNDIVPGTYLFKSSLGIIDAETRIVSGIFGIPAKKVTIPEGFSNLEIANRLEANLPTFNKQLFLNIASTSEGYLYPETYFFIPSDDEKVIYNKMIAVFNDKTKSLQADFDTSLRSKEEMITMASVLEMEVKSKEDKKIVSGILWNRIKIGMPLQVDASLAYERNKNSYTLTTEDLRTDSKYNTYTRKGLPPTPISNPGFDAIEAALKPTPNQYLYFLTDKEGNVYYAKTYAEHLKNKAKYFNK